MEGRLSLIRLIITAILLFTLIGCQGGVNAIDVNEKHGIIGYVVSKENGRILVVDPNPQDFSSTGGNSNFHNAIAFSNVPETIEVGQKVRVWFDEVAESYPGQSKAKRIAIVENKKPESAHLTEAQAIQSALNLVEFEAIGITAVLAANYNETQDVWNVELKKGESNFEIQIKDEI